MTCPKPDEYDQIYDGEWMDVPPKWHLQCCSCGLVHEIQVRLRDGRLQMAFTVDRKETRKARRRRLVKRSKV